MENAIVHMDVDLASMNLTAGQVDSLQDLFYLVSNICVIVPVFRGHIASGILVMSTAFCVFGLYYIVDDSFSC